jgi:hypothetical protein
MFRVSGPRDNVLEATMEGADYNNVHKARGGGTNNDVSL